MMWLWRIRRVKRMILLKALNRHMAFHECTHPMELMKFYTYTWIALSCVAAICCSVSHFLFFLFFFSSLVFIDNRAVPALLEREATRMILHCVSIT